MCLPRRRKITFLNILELIQFAGGMLVSTFRCIGVDYMLQKTFSHIHEIRKQLSN